MPREELHDDAAKECGVIGARALVPSNITYEPKINSRTVQGERTKAGERQDRGEADGGTETVGEAQGGRGRTVNGAARLIGQPGQVVVPAESRADVSAHGKFQPQCGILPAHDAWKGSCKGRERK